MKLTVTKRDSLNNATTTTKTRLDLIYLVYWYIILKVITLSNTLSILELDSALAHSLCSVNELSFISCSTHDHFL